MTDHSPEGPRFALVARGYDRAQVDAAVTEGERWASQAEAQMQHVATQLAKADERVKVLEGRMTELEDRVAQGPPPSIQWLGGVADQVLGVTGEAAAELRARIEQEATAEKAQLAQAGAEAREAAVARAAEIQEAARRDQEEAARGVTEARAHAELSVGEAKARAEQQADVIRNESQARIDELRAEKEGVEGRRQAAAAELDKVRGVLEELMELLAKEL